MKYKSKRATSKTVGYTEAHALVESTKQGKVPRKIIKADEKDLKRVYQAKLKEYPLISPGYISSKQTALSLLHLAAITGNDKLFKIIHRHTHAAYKASSLVLKESSRQKGKKVIHKMRLTGILPLHLAVQHNHAKIVKYLIRRNFDVTRSMKIQMPAVYHWNALHIIAVTGHRKMFNHLIDYFPTIDERTIHGLTPLHLSIMNQHPKIAIRLIQKGASPALTVLEGEYQTMNALHLACLFDLPEVVNAILKTNAVEVNQTAIGDVHALHLAALLSRHPKVITALVEAGADPMAKTSGLKFNALQLANKNRNDGIILTLLQYFPDVSLSSFYRAENTKRPTESQKKPHSLNAFPLTKKSSLKKLKRPSSVILKKTTKRVL